MSCARRPRPGRSTRLRIRRCWPRNHRRRHRRKATQLVSPAWPECVWPEGPPQPKSHARRTPCIESASPEGPDEKGHTACPGCSCARTLPAALRPCLHPLHVPSAASRQPIQAGPPVVPGTSARLRRHVLALRLIDLQAAVDLPDNSRSIVRSISWRTARWGEDRVALGDRGCGQAGTSPRCCSELVRRWLVRSWQSEQQARAGSRPSPPSRNRKTPLPARLPLQRHLRSIIVAPAGRGVRIRHLPWNLICGK